VIPSLKLHGVRASRPKGTQLRTPLRSQSGSFMLEALVAILIVALGILGIVGLYARSIQNVDDSKYRGEAALLTNSLVGQMWTDNGTFATLQANYDSVTPGTGAGYVEFKNVVAQRFPNSVPPVVTVTAGPTAASTNVSITIQWRHPGDPVAAGLRTYNVSATIGANS
jgi:type IV pilus assembly protein PilV